MQAEYSWRCVGLVVPQNVLSEVCCVVSARSNLSSAGYVQINLADMSINIRRCIKLEAEEEF